MSTSNILSQLAGAIITPLIFYGLSRLFPYQKVAPARFLTQEEMKLLHPKMQQYNGLSLVLFLTVTPLTIWTIYEFLSILHQVLPKPADSFNFSFEFDKNFWLLPAFCFGFVGAFWPMIFILKLIFGRYYELLNHAYSQLYGFDGRAVMKWMVIVFVAAGVTATFILSNVYAGVQDQEVVINTFWEVKERRYPLKEIEKITFVDLQRIWPNRKVELPQYEIKFQDGFVWTTRESLRSVPKELDKPIFEFLSQRTGLPLLEELRIEHMKEE